MMKEAVKFPQKNNSVHVYIILFCITLFTIVSLLVFQHKFKSRSSIKESEKAETMVVDKSVQAVLLNNETMNISEVRWDIFDPIYGNVDDLFIETGAKMDRVPCFWDETEAIKGTYDFSKCDQRIRNYTDHHIELIMVVTVGSVYSESFWANEKCGRVGCPIDQEDFNAFGILVKNLAERYDTDGYLDAPGSPKAVIFELDNEWDHYTKYAGPNDLNQNGIADYRDYAKLQKIFYEKIKEANSNSIIGTNGLAAANCCGFDLNFLPKVLNYSQTTWNSQYFDYLILHYYEGFFDSWASYDSYSGGGLRGQISWAKGLLSTYQAGNKPILYTEFGDIPPINDPECEEKQARSVLKLYARGFSTAQGPFWWFTLKDYPDGSSDNNYGLVRPDDSKKPAFYVYQNLVKELDGYSFYSTDDPAKVNLEGYIFQHDNYSMLKKEILWAKNNTESADFQAHSILVNDKLGAEQLVADGDANDLDGLINGNIKISVGIDPRLVEWGDTYTLTPTPTQAATSTPSPSPTLTITPTPTLNPCSLCGLEEIPDEACRNIICNIDQHCTPKKTSCSINPDCWDWECVGGPTSTPIPTPTCIPEGATCYSSAPDSGNCCAPLICEQAGTNWAECINPFTPTPINSPTATPTISPKLACQYDINGNGKVGADDLLVVLQNWNSSSLTKLYGVLHNIGAVCKI